jgi:hypothetical protein
VWKDVDERLFDSREERVDVMAVNGLDEDAVRAARAAAFV